MADVFAVLSQDHEEVKRMLTELETGPTRATGASEDLFALRKKMTEQLIIEESRHEALEEMYFWPVVRDHLPDGDTLADQATGQEQEAKEVLANGGGRQGGRAHLRRADYALPARYTGDHPRRAHHRRASRLPAHRPGGGHAATRSRRSQPRYHPGHIP